MITVKMTLGYDDYLKYNITYNATHKLLRHTRWIFPLLLAIIVLVLNETVAGQSLWQPADIIEKVITGVFVFLIAFGIFYIVKKLSMPLLRYRTKRLYTAQTTEWYIYELEFGAIGIEYRNKAGAHKLYSWNNIFRITENEDALYLHYEPKRAFILLKRYVPSTVELDAIRQLSLRKSRAKSIEYRSLKKGL